MIYIVKINDREYEVEVEKGKANMLRTTVVTPAEAMPAPVTVIPVASKNAPAVTRATGEAIKAPMPGTMIDIKVNTGTSVKKGDVIFILEAMKMENEITAPADGVVAQILVDKNASVATGDVLMIIQ